MPNPPRDHGSDRGVHTHRAEQMLIEHLDDLPGDRLLCTTLGRAQFAAVAALRSPQRRVTCHFLDVFRAEESRRLHGDIGGRLTLACTPDFPEGEFDAAAIPGTATGEAELVRERMQDAYLRLAEGGRLAVASDNSDDNFFNVEMKKLFPKVTRVPGERAVLYLGTKRGPLKKVKDFAATFPFRDGERLLTQITRPGVFSHRRIDPGTRALLDVLTITPGMRVLDLGCGAGPVATAVAARADGVTVEAVDANPRALECTRRTAEANGLTGIRTHLSADARGEARRTIDLAAGNPPYFSHYRIAEIFVDSAADALRDGGRVVLVTKQPAWFLEHLPPRFTAVTSQQVRNYAVVSGVRRR